MSGADDEISELKKQVVGLKQVQRNQADVMRVKKKKWDVER